MTSSCGTHLDCSGSLPCLDNVMLGDLVVDHIRACRRIKGLKDSLSVLMIESNMPGIAQSIMRTIRERQLVNCVIMRDKDGNTGCRTTPQNKPSMVYDTQTIMREKRIVFHRDFTTFGIDYCPEDDLRDTLIAEMRSFTRTIIPSKTNPDNVSERFSGKASGGKDDFVMALMINIYWRKLFLVEERYRMYR